MKTTTPSIYKAGLKRIEELSTVCMIEWLEGELKEINHVLVGSRDDYPVQAIVNHHPYLSLEAQKRMADAIDQLVLDWRKTPSDWPENAARALLSLAAELRVSAVKPMLQAIAKDKRVFAKTTPLQAEVLRSIATLSVNVDRFFWSEIAGLYPNFAGMAFQVLARIAPEDALTFLAHLPQNEAAIGGVARKLPGFVSQFPEGEKSEVLSRIAKSLAAMTDTFSNPLRIALTEAGFSLPLAANGGTWNSGSMIVWLHRSTGRDPLPSSVVLGSYCEERQLA